MMSDFRRALCVQHGPFMMRNDILVGMVNINNEVILVENIQFAVKGGGASGIKIAVCSQIEQNYKEMNEMRRELAQAKEETKVVKAEAVKTKEDVHFYTSKWRAAEANIDREMENWATKIFE